MATEPNQQPMTFDAAPTQQPMTFDSAPTQQPMTFDSSSGNGNPPTPPQPSLLSRATDFVHAAMETNPQGQQIVGTVKDASTALGGILNIINQHAGGAIPNAAKPDMAKAAQWLKNQGELRGWSEPGGAEEHLGAMGADYLGWEGLQALAAGAKGMAAGAGVVKNFKAAANVGDVLDNYPVLKQAAGIGLRAIHEVMNVAGPAAGTAATGYGQTYLMSGGDTEQAKTAGVLSGILHLGGAPVLGPLADSLGEYIAGLKRDAAAVDQPAAPPLFREAEPKPEAPTRTPEPQPQPPAGPAPRAPAAERLAAVEQPTAQAVTQASLEDLNRFRTVDANGTPTNIQQLGLPSQSVTQPYQFVVPGWSATSEAGDLLHDAGARYRQTGTRTVEGRGSGNMQPWEMQQNPPFDLPQYAQEPGAVLSTKDPTTGEPSPPPEPPVIPSREAATPPETPTISHREPIMTVRQYQTAVRPGSQIGQSTTIGGPSIVTTDPEVAAGHLDQIERIVQGPNFDALPPQRQADILASRNQVMRQMQEYRNLVPQHEYSPYLHQPTFEPMDIEAALNRVGDMGDAADEMMRGPKDMYQRWTDLTQTRPGGSFKNLNDEIGDLGGQNSATSRQRLAQAQQEMQQMFSGNDPYIGRAGTNIDRAIASAQFNDGYLVKRVDDAFTNAYSGAARSGDLSVSKLQGNWKALVNDVGEPRMSNVLGADRYQAINNVINDMAGEPAGDKAAAAAADAQHQAALTDWKQREATATAAQKLQHQNAMADWTQRNTLRKQVNQANLNEWQQNDAISKAAKEKWYYNLAKNGWYHTARAAGMEGVAGILPQGAAKVLSAKVGAALIMKNILMRPEIAKVAYRGAQMGTNPAIYGPVISDMIRHYTPAATPAPNANQP